MSYTVSSFTVILTLTFLTFLFVDELVSLLVFSLEDETQKQYPEIEWIIIKNLRNKIVHDYEGINLTIIWDILTNDLMPLKNNLQKILNKSEE